MKSLKNTIVKNILLSLCSVISIGTVGTTVYNTVLVENLKQQNNEIISILEEKDNKISNLQQQIEETKTALTEVPKQSADKETTEENQNITSNANTNNIKTPSKPTQSASTYENTRETRKQELIKQRDELQKQIDNKNTELKNKKQKFNNEDYELYTQENNIKKLLENSQKDSEQYQVYEQQLQEVTKKRKENDKEYEATVGRNSPLKQEIYSLIKQRDAIQQQINEL